MKVNRGSIVVEASLVIPIFLFFMLSMAGIFWIMMAEAHIHQALGSATDHVAEQCYLKEKLLENKQAKTGQNNSERLVENLVESALIKSFLIDYIGKDRYIEKYITGGKNGIFITVKADVNNPKIMIVTASYQGKFVLPLLGTHSISLSNQIKQKAFVGFTEEEYQEENCFVYVTPNREAYHLRRDCTHILLDVNTKAASRKGNLAPCHYCGYSKTDRVIYVAVTGEVYHNKRDCVGLKRSVARVQLSTVKDLGACLRCGG